jgi:hypothetical protein
VIEDLARKSPEIRKTSGIRNGLPKLATACIQPSWPAARSTPSVECIIATKTIQKPLT